MKNLLLPLLSVILFACGSDGGGPSGAPGAPSWSGGYPQVAQGAVSVDLNFKTDKASKVYWVIASSSLDLESDDIKTQALDPSNAAIKFHGVTEVTTADTEVRETVKKLSEHKKYYVYITAENTSDTTATTLVNQSDFTTYYRQDTADFHSTAENRTALYLIYQPEEALKYPEEEYPILYFLGGNGEVATDLKPINMINGNGTLPEYIKKGNDVPMIVMSIQHTVKDWNADFIDEGVEHGLKTYPVDKKKVYLTGISGGGFGCWRYSLDHAAKLTAIVPISGGGNTSKACNLKNIPVWAFHNQTDNTVASSNSTDMINAINNCPSTKEVKLLFFPDEGHNCWRRVFDQNHKDWSKSPGVAKFDIYKWLLSKSK
jgi:predicted peptidase